LHSFDPFILFRINKAPDVLAIPQLSVQCCTFSLFSHDWSSSR